MRKTEIILFIKETQHYLKGLNYWIQLSFILESNIECFSPLTCGGQLVRETGQL